MKTIILLLLALNCFAWPNEAPLEITNWNSQIAIDQQELIDIIYSETAWNYFAGDDGEECEGRIEEIELTSISGDKYINQFSLWYRASLEEAHHCLFTYDLICEANFDWTDIEHKYSPKNWIFQIQCEFQ